MVLQCNVFERDIWDRAKYALLTDVIFFDSASSLPSDLISTPRYVNFSTAPILLLQLFGTKCWYRLHMRPAVQICSSWTTSLFGVRTFHGPIAYSLFLFLSCFRKVGPVFRDCLIECVIIVLYGTRLSVSRPTFLLCLDLGWLETIKLLNPSNGYPGGVKCSCNFTKIHSNQVRVVLHLWLLKKNGQTIKIVSLKL